MGSEMCIRDRSSLRRKKRRVITEDEPFDLYDIELSDEDFAAE